MRIMAKSGYYSEETSEGSTMTRPSLRLAFAGALMLLAQSLPQLAHAQYSWLDDKGTRMFSDRPPPPGTPASRILKAPHRNEAAGVSAPAASASAAATPAAAGSPAAAPKAPPSLADREADYRKRQAQQQADEKKAQLEAAHAAQQQQVCADARQDEAQLASGIRISQMDASGERSFLSDEERGRRLARARQALAQCK
jgi:hypothetical protein